MSAPQILELFAGACGGWSVGLHRAGFETLAACEIDPWRRSVYAKNFPEVRLYDDVRLLTAERILRECGRLPDMLVASPPCQDASAANPKGRGAHGARTGLFFDAIRLAAECGVDWCVFENSAHLRTRGADGIFDALARKGYALWPFVGRAYDVGAPHERARSWIIAFNAAQIGRAGRRAWRCGPKRHAAATGAGDRGRLAGLFGELDRRAPDWNGGLGRHLRLGDGVPAGLAHQCIAAYGDAIVPDFAEIIGRAILRVEASL